MKTKVSVIIPNFNRAESLKKTLTALAQQTTPPDQYEVIVVDDGSTDDSLHVVDTLNLPYSLILVQQSNRGPGPARNKGAQQSLASKLVFLDADMIPASDLVERYLDILDQYAPTIVIGRQIPCAESYSRHYIDVFLHSLVSDLGATATSAKFHALASGNFAIDHCTFDVLHGFDERLRMNEDVDLGYRAAKIGLNILYDPNIKGFHDHLKSPEKIYTQTQSAAWWTAYLIELHPEISGQIPVYQTVEPIHWGKDPIGLVFRKVFTRFFANPFIIFILERIVLFLLNASANVRYTQYILRKIETGHRVIGYNAYLKNRATHPEYASLANL